MSRRKPIQRGAVRVVFAPLNERDAKERSRGRMVLGETLVPGRTIKLDPRTELTQIIVHELLHVRHPGWTEDEVVVETKVRMEQMTWKEKARLLRDVCGAALLEGEDHVRKDSEGHRQNRHRPRTR